MISFTFEVINEQAPKITIGSQPFAIASCVYMWTTATDKSLGVKTAIVSGFIQGESTQRNFRLIFSNGEAIEFI